MAKQSKCTEAPVAGREESSQQMEAATEALAALMGDAVRVLQEGMRSDDPAHALRCATAVLNHAARLGDFKRSRLEMEPSMADVLRF